VEKYIGKMGKKSTIELTKPFGYDYLTETYLRDYILIRKQIMNCLPLDSHILDMGCGGGWFAIFLSYEGYNIDGMELSPLLDELAQKRYASWHSNGRCDFFTGDIENAKIDKKYDLVIIYETLHHTESPDKTIENASQHIKKNGYIILKEPNFVWTITGVRSAFINENTERGFTKRHLKALLRNNGFRSIKFFKNKLGFFLRDIYVLARKP